MAALSAAAAAGKHQRHGSTAASAAVKQVTKGNFSSALQQMKAHIEQSDFIAVSSQKTSGFSSSWRRVLPIDAPDVAYLKSKAAADSFQLLQLAVCPFSLRGSKVHAFPYNFHLFPRDELNLAMPSYSFSCQTSFLTSMAREGFDFNACIYDGLSYLSRVQESKAKERISAPRVRSVSCTLNPSVADSLFMGRIKTRVEHWRNACKKKDSAADDSLVKSLRKLILGNELYGSRPCISIDVCSDRQVQLVLEIVNQIGDDLVPLVVPDKSGQVKAVRVVLTSSDDDKNLLMGELENLEEEQNLKVRGFREVIDLISASQKPIISYNCVHDFTFIHSQFLAPLPPSLSEFLCSLRMAFPNIVDVNHLSKGVGPLRKAKNLSSTLSYLKRQFFVPIELEIPWQDCDGNSEKSHGHNVLRITSLFAKLCNVLKIPPACQTPNGDQQKSVEDYANVFYPTCTSLKEPWDDEDVDLSLDDYKRTSTDNLVFLWGLPGRITASELKHRLQRSLPAISGNFDLQPVDKTCSVAVFWTRDEAWALLEAMESEEGGSGALGELISNGLRGAGYEAYRKMCKLGLWEGRLADCFETALAELEAEDGRSASSSSKNASEIYWNGELMIDLDGL